MSSSQNELFLLEEPMVAGVDHFLCPTEEREEPDDPDIDTGPNSGFLGDLLRDELAAQEGPIATLFENGVLTRSASCPCIFYWKGALNALTFSTDGLFRIVSGPHPSSSDFSEVSYVLREKKHIVPQLFLAAVCWGSVERYSWQGGNCGN
jgi:hypothetical protein